MSFKTRKISPLSRGFLGRETVTVARELLGHHLIVRPRDGRTEIVCRIVETEAYTQDDPACHAYGRTTGRAATLYKMPGLAYVYFIYGMYHCLNVVTDAEGRGGAVLIRALEPLMPPDLKTRGPGRLTRALAITRADHNEVDMTCRDSPLVLVHGDPPPQDLIVQTTRIGISRASDSPWRFYIRDNPWVSVF